ncbi:MAG TPA: hypothetical protein VL242_01485, partial [Sorangium sp.]|nr:hypothetical protein [Sorangium sp.]
MADHPLGRLELEEIGRVLELDPDAPALVLDIEAKIELRCRGGELSPGRGLQPRQPEQLRRALLICDHDLEQRVATEVVRHADLADYLVERRVLELEHLEADLAHAGEQLRDGDVVGDADPHRQQVHEVADQTLRAGAVAPGDRRTEA